MRISICMITYNHQQYIAEAIKSVLMQKGNFTWELVIGEDCSTDKTREIVKLYQQQNPANIKLLLRDKNIGMMANFVGTLEACKGDYVAILEGDDYWTDDQKLQKQLDFMNANPEYSICYHNAEVHIMDTEKKYLANNHKQSQGTLEDLIMGNDFSKIMTASIFFRNHLLQAFPPWLIKMHAGDRALPLILAQYGSIYFLNEVMSIYRVHGGGMSSLKNYNYYRRGAINLMNALKTELDKEYHSLIRKRKSDIYLEWALTYRKYYGALFRPMLYFFLSLWYNLVWNKNQIKAIIADDLFHDLHKRWKVLAEQESISK